MLLNHEDQPRAKRADSAPTSDLITSSRGDSPKGFLDRPESLALSASLAINLVLLQWLSLTSTTSLRGFFAMNAAIYTWSSVLLAVVLSLLFGITAARLAYAGRGKAELGSWMSLSLGAAFLVFSAGCPACGAPLLEGLGISSGLAEFPLQGLEIKVLGGLLLGGALWASVGRNAVRSGDLEAVPSDAVAIGPPSAQWGLPLSILLLVSIIALYLLPRLPDQIKVNFVSDSMQVSDSAPLNSPNTNQITPRPAAFPEEPYTLNATYGDIGPALLSRGVIDYEGFVGLFDQAGHPLSPNQRQILQTGVDRRISIEPDNAHFLLNFFWALGLSNRNPLLESGRMEEISQGDIGRFASTGGWSLGRMPGSELYSAFEILPLMSDQQRLLAKVASSVYRPCCNNPAAIPDCNHGMAMLGVLELMAAQGATEAEMFEAAKQINGFWFPHQMQHVADFFKATQGWDYAEIPGEIASGPAVFSGTGHQNLVTQMDELRLLDRSPDNGASCGV